MASAYVTLKQRVDGCSFEKLRDVLALFDLESHFDSCTSESIDRLNEMMEFLGLHSCGISTEMPVCDYLTKICDVSTMMVKDPKSVSDKNHCVFVCMAMLFMRLFPEYESPRKKEFGQYENIALKSATISAALLDNSIMNELVLSGKVNDNDTSFFETEEGRKYTLRTALLAFNRKQGIDKMYQYELLKDVDGNFVIQPDQERNNYLCDITVKGNGNVNRDDRTINENNSIYYNKQIVSENCDHEFIWTKRFMVGLDDILKPSDCFPPLIQDSYDEEMKKAVTSRYTKKVMDLKVLDRNIFTQRCTKCWMNRFPPYFTGTIFAPSELDILVRQGLGDSFFIPFNVKGAVEFRVARQEVRHNVFKYHVIGKNGPLKQNQLNLLVMNFGWYKLKPEKRIDPEIYLYNGLVKEQQFRSTDFTHCFCYNTDERGLIVDRKITYLYSYDSINHRAFRDSIHPRFQVKQPSAPTVETVKAIQEYLLTTPNDLVPRVLFFLLNPRAVSGVNVLSIQMPTDCILNDIKHNYDVCLYNRLS